MWVVTLLLEEVCVSVRVNARKFGVVLFHYHSRFLTWILLILRILRIPTAFLLLSCATWRATWRCATRLLLVRARDTRLFITRSCATRLC